VPEVKFWEISGKTSAEIRTRAIAARKLMIFQPVFYFEFHLPGIPARFTMHPWNRCLRRTRSRSTS